MLLWGVVLALAAWAMMPHFVSDGRNSPALHCIANLKQIDGAKEQWALEHKAEVGTKVTFTELVGTNSFLKNTPQCPSKGTYTVGAVDEVPICSVGTNKTPPHVLPP